MYFWKVINVSKKVSFYLLYMEKDQRYKSLAVLLNAGYIQSFQEIFNHIPKTVVAHDLGTNNMRLSRLIQHPDQLSIKQINLLSFIISVDPMIIIGLIYAQLSKSKARKK